MGTSVSSDELQAQCLEHNIFQDAEMEFKKYQSGTEKLSDHDYYYLNTTSFVIFHVISKNTVLQIYCLYSVHDRC